MWAELKLALRLLARAPGYTAAVVGALALGMGAATAFFSNLQWTSDPYGVPEMERLVRIESSSRDSTYPLPLFLSRHVAYRERATSFTGLAGGIYDVLNLVVNGEPEGVAVARVTANYFNVLGLAPALGRTFRPGEDEAGRDGVVVLSHGLWRDRFGSAADVVGKTVLLNERSYEVVGVLPETFRSPPATLNGRMFLPYVMPPGTTPSASFIPVSTIARLKSGVTREQAQAELQTLAVDVPARFAEMANRYQTVVSAGDAMPLSDGRQRFNAMQWTASAAVACLYLIASVNAGSLVLVRMLARRRDTGVRLALGGGRWAVARPWLAEALLLSALGAGLGALVAKWLMPALMMLASDAADGAYRPLTLRWEMLAALAALSVVTGLVIASVPAWRSARLGINEALKDRTQGGGESRRMRVMRNGLVVLEAALAVALLTVTGVMIRTVRRLQDYDPGFATERRFQLNLQLSREERIPPVERLERFKQVVERLRQLPGVADVAISGPFSPTGGNVEKFKIDGQTEAGEAEATVMCVAPNFPDLIALPLRAGRPLSALREGDPPAVVVSETLARNCFPGRNPIGERLELNAREKWEIAGVVGDVRSAREGPKPRFYYPYWQRKSALVTQVTIRTAAAPGPKFNSEVRRAVYEVEPKVAVLSISRLDQSLVREVSTERFAMVVLEVLAGMALLLALLGLFSMMAYNVAQRRAEFGIRLTFGATPGSIRRLVIGHGLRLAAAGVVIGLGLAWGLSRLMVAMLYRTSGLDPLVCGLVGLLMLLVALPACWLPAWKAGRLDVARLLRTE